MNEDILRDLCKKQKDEIERLKKTKTKEHRAWEALMYGTPDGTKPLPVYLHKGKVVVTGDPIDEDKCEHNCDAMGCTSVSHVIWRGTYEDFCEMCCKSTDEEFRESFQPKPCKSSIVLSTVEVRKR